MSWGQESKQLASRWTEGSGKEFVDLLVRFGRSGNGHEVAESPFGLSAQGLLDLRGLHLAKPADLRRVRFAPADFSGASFKRGWLERCDFKDAVLDLVSFQWVSDQGNSFSNCVLLRTSFREAVIGYRGSRFQKCTFECADFGRTGFVRPEFDECAFHHCKLKGVDFGGSSFKRCRFVGELNDVWFRGGFAHADDLAQYGQPRPNDMLEVSFENASLHGLTFSNHCDLSTVRLPTDGRTALIDDWPVKLAALQEQFAEWPGELRKAAEVFASIYLVHAKTQNYFILNHDELANDWGEKMAELIWKVVAADR